MQDGISIFHGAVSRAGEFDAIAARIGLGSMEEDDRALGELRALAEEVGEPEALNRFALGLYSAHRHLEAGEVLRQLLSAVETDAYRLNLAAAYSQAEFIQLCRHELRTVAEQGTDPELRRLALHQLGRYEAFLGLDDETQRLRKLQLAALDGADPSEAPLERLVRLASLLLAQGRITGEEDLVERARILLEPAIERFPGNEEIVRLLLQIHIGSDDDRPLSRLLEAVRRRDPQSSLLRLIDSYSDEPIGSAYNVRADALGDIASESPDAAEAACSDLARLCAMHGGNSYIRLHYAWLLLVQRKEGEARAQASRLKSIAGRSHAFHFNLGQLLWLTGDPGSGRRHLEASIEQASTEEEVEDARSAIRRLEAEPL